MSVQTMDDTDQALLDAARALVPRVRACADEIERERRLPQSLADALAAAGLFKLTVPRALGGAEAHPETVVRVIETLAAADGSAGWCVGIAAQCGIASGFFGAEAARAIYGDPAAFVALVTFRAGRARAVEGGYRVTGRWSFASGCRHATWLGGGATIYDGEQPRLGADGQPEARFFYFPAMACEIFDTWHVTGLRGTGSHEFAVADAFVPEDLTLDISFSTRQPPARLYAFGIGLITPAFAATALGIARGALDALAELAAKKAPRAGGGVLLRDQPVTQHRVGVAEAELRGARALLLATIRDVWEELGRAGAITEEQITLLDWASAHATAMAARAVDTAWELAGGAAVFAGSPFERRFRDVHMVTQQFVVNAARYAEGGRLFLAPPAPAG